MKPVAARRGEIIGGIWLVGIGLLLYAGRFWPGIMFLIAVTSCIEGYFYNGLWKGLQAGYWAAFIGAWALAGFSFVFLFVGLGLSTILGALLKPGPVEKPAPFVDASLE
ncbi:hypothetical protein OJF2_28720 [Aquisphaera giovannonii]|uniref:Uncharacterized protein n=1 Tax=Aquisphaera giovannonii TaxID=406548 RepID=A0A5B9W176_9BACT|nr:hypothetical protein [Aquisphaera giovannonii]QEH34336.1 hypothetical protein OJF2_28720 [Aquisphaera giovannonii]